MTRHCPDSVSCRTNSFRPLSFQKILIRNKSVPNFGSSKANGRGAFEGAEENVPVFCILLLLKSTDFSTIEIFLGTPCGHEFTRTTVRVK